MTQLQSVTFNKHIMAANRVFHDRCIQPKEGEAFYAIEAGVLLQVRDKNGLAPEILVPWANVTCVVAEHGDSFDV